MNPDTNCCLLACLNLYHVSLFKFIFLQNIKFSLQKTDKVQIKTKMAILSFRLQYMYSERKKSPGTVQSGDSTIQITRRTKPEILHFIVNHLAFTEDLSWGSPPPPPPSQLLHPCTICCTDAHANEPISRLLSSVLLVKRQWYGIFPFDFVQKTRLSPLIQSLEPF